MRERIYLSPPFTGEAEQHRVMDALASGWVAPCGPAVDAFEAGLAALSGCAAAAVSSGSAALDLLAAEYDIGPASTILATSQTFIATVSAFYRRGAQLIFIDSDVTTGTLSLSLLEAALRDHPGRDTFIVAADIYGQCCDYPALESLAAQYDAHLLVDAAESVGAHFQGRPAGQAGEAAVFSFNGNKIITTSGGGAVLSRDAELVSRARWRSQQSREAVIWYEHREVGYNYRLSNISAAIGCAQLERLADIIARKRRHFAHYSELLAEYGVTPFPMADEAGSTHWLSVFLFPTSEQRDQVAEALAAADIESRPVWKPMHLQPVFQHCEVRGGEVAADFFARGLCLPSGAGLTETQFERIAVALQKGLCA